MPSTISAGTTAGTAIAIAGDTSGDLAFRTNGTTTAMTINTSQNVQLNAAGARILNSSGNPILLQTGSILQVVSTTKTDTFTTTSTSYVDVTGFSATITPTSTASRILIIATWHGNNNNGGMSSIWFRNATRLPISTNTSPVDGSSGQAFNTGGSTVQPMSYSYLDSPASTSALTYKMQTRAGAGTSFFNISPNNEYGAISTLTLMEIAG